MDRRAGPGRQRPFLIDGEQEAWDNLDDLLAGRIFDRPEDAEPLKVPPVWSQYRLLKHFGWTWQQLEDTPLIHVLELQRCMDADLAGEAARSKPKPPPRPEHAVQSDLAAARAALGDEYRPPED